MMQREQKRRGPMLTPKQLTTLRALVKRNPDGSYLDVQELLKAVAPNTVRGSMLCTLQHLAMHDLVREDDLVQRRGRRVRTYAATQKGINLLRPHPANANVVIP